MLTTRGIRTPEEAADFLLSGELEDDPFGFADMDAAVDRIQRAIDRGERIAVFGDYDADGVTSTVLLYDYLVSGKPTSFIRSLFGRERATASTRKRWIVWRRLARS